METANMKRKPLTKLLVHASESFCTSLARQVEACHHIETIDPPSESLVLIKVKESAQNSQFYLGEVLVTEARVRIDHSIGLGILQGHHPEKAKAMAIIDAAIKTDPVWLETWHRSLADEEKRQEQEHNTKWGMTQTTRVNFYTMDTEVTP
jgi:alpha-D-ribose 1-methylphosphonate 5-triphosphate synthase subunit PhnG